MKLITYQSIPVLKILQSKQVYRASPSISFKKEYGALIDLLNLNCDCPIFTVVKNRKHNTSGKVSGSVRLELDVPDEFVRLTEFGVWADLMFGLKFTRDDRIFTLTPAGYEAVDNAKFTYAIEHITDQKPLDEYKYPQAILEEIKPEWLVSYKLMSKSDKNINLMEKIGNLFKK